MNQVVAAFPEREIHLVLDNLCTHKPKRDMWLTLRKNVHFHCTSHLARFVVEVIDGLDLRAMVRSLSQLWVAVAAHHPR